MSDGTRLRRRVRDALLVGTCLFLLLVSNFQGIKPNQMITSDDKSAIHVSSALFNGLYVRWNGTDPNKASWWGNESLVQTGLNFFKCTEYSTTIGWDRRGINDTNRVVNGSSIWGLAGKKHEWLYIFTNVKLNDKVPIIVVTSENLMNVSGEADVRNNYLKATFNCWKLTDTNGSVVYYDKGTGLLINGTFKYNSGTLSYVIVITSTNEPFVNNFAPTLKSGQVLPSTGNTSTYFTYSVNYTDSDDNPPYSINAIIDGTPYKMTKVNPNDHNYKDGCIFSYTTLLANVSHSYYFNASDSVHDSRLPTSGAFSGPSVNYFNTHPPTLTGGKVTPLNGNTYQRVTFQVNYTDKDSDPPSYVNVTINSTTYSMQKKNPGDNIYLDGCLYEQLFKLFEGNYTYYFTTSDGVNVVRAPLAGAYNGPFIQKVNWIFMDDAENGRDGWTTSGTPTSTNTTGWHLVSTNYRSPTHAWWCGDDSTGKTGNNWNCRLVSPLINLTNAYFVNFSFYHKYEIDDMFDYGYVELQINGTTQWVQLMSFTGTQSTWIQAARDLSSYKGKYIYISFRFQSDPVVTRNGWYLDDIVIDALRNIYAPTLSSPTVTPALGNTSTLFTYQIIYTDLDNNPPTSVQVRIDGTSYPMAKYNPSDFNYRDGCLYSYSSYLTNISHSYYFTASDGNYTGRSPAVGNYSGPMVNLINLAAPVLQNASLTPIEDLYYHTFNFRVTYLDQENQAPFYMNVTINGTSYRMNKEIPGDNIYLDGVAYICSKAMPTDGIYVYHFIASDGGYATRFPSSGEFVGPYTVLYAMSLGIPYSNSLDNVTNPTNSYKQYFEPDKWLGFGLRPASNIKVNLNLFGNYLYSDFLVNSLATDNRVNFLLYNAPKASVAKYYYLQASIQRGSGSYRIESNDNPTLPAILFISKENFTGYFNPNEVLQVCLVGGQEVGRTYNLTVNVPANMDLDIYIFNRTGGRKDAIACSRNIGNGVDETLLFRLTSSSNFTLVFTDENGASGYFTFNITPDLAAPTVSIISPLNRTYNKPSIDVNLSCSAPDLHRMWFRVRNSTTWVTTNITWTSSTQLTLADGIYTLYAWANDTEGNIQAHPSKVVFTIDTISPTVTINSPQAITYFKNSIPINLSSSDFDISSFWYRIFNRTSRNWLDQTNITWTASSFRTLPEGNYSLFAWVNDTAGNVQKTTVSVNFTINTPPIVIIVNPLNKTYTNSIIDVILSSPSPDIQMLWYCIWNGSKWIVGNTTWYLGSKQPLGEGTFTLFAWGNDSFGLISASVNRTFSIDITAPKILIISPLNGTYHVPDILINFSCGSSDLSAIWYRFFNKIGGIWVDSQNVSWTGPILHSFADGYYMLCVWANDTFGNVLHAPVTLNFTIDAPPYLLSISITNGTISVTGRLLLNISSDAADLDTIWYRIFNGMTWITGNITWTRAITLELANGSYLLFIWANDTQGNEIYYLISFRVQIPPPNGTNSIIILVIFLVIGAVAAVGIYYRIKKTRKMKAKSKSGKESKTFAERVQPKDLKP